MEDEVDDTIVNNIEKRSVITLCYSCCCIVSVVSIGLFSTLNQ